MWRSLLHLNFEVFLCFCLLVSFLYVLDHFFKYSLLLIFYFTSTFKGVIGLKWFCTFFQPNNLCHSQQLHPNSLYAGACKYILFPPNAHCLPVYIYEVFCCAGWRKHKWLLCGHLPAGLPLPSHWSHHRSDQGQEPALSRSERSAHHYGSLEPLQGWNDSVEANIMSLLISFMQS